MKMSATVFLLMGVMIVFTGCRTESGQPQDVAEAVVAVDETTEARAIEAQDPENVFDVPSYLGRDYGVVKTMLGDRHGQADLEEKHKDDVTGIEVWQLSYLRRPGPNAARMALMFQSFAGDESPVFLAIVAAEEGIGLDDLLKSANLDLNSESYQIELTENKERFRYWLQVRALQRDRN